MITVEGRGCKWEGGGEGWGLAGVGGKGRELCLNNNKIREEKKRQPTTLSVKRILINSI